MTDVKKPGCCTLCDAEVFPISRRYARDHVLQSEPMGVGWPPHEGTRRVQFVLLDGSRMDLTFCASCETTPENLPRIWRKTVTAMVRSTQPAHRAAISAAPLSPEAQRAAEDRLRHFSSTIPLGVIRTRLWIDEVENAGRAGTANPLTSL